MLISAQKKLTFWMKTEKKMLLKNTFKNRGTKGKRKTKKYFATVLS